MDTPTQDRRVNDAKFDAISARLEHMAKQQVVFASALRQNTELTKKLSEDTAGMVEAWAALSGTVKVVKWVAAGVTVIAGAIAAVLGIWYTGQGGNIGPL